jgi:hypothetical protein
MSSSEILDGQTIVLKRGRMNGLGFEPAWNSYFDFYISPKYISPSLLKLEDMSFHLYLRKNLNDRDPSWKMPTIRQMKRKLGVSYDRLHAMMARLEKAHLLYKESGLRKGEGGENIRNTYILSDPIQDLAEFLIVATAGVFPNPLRAEWVQPTEFDPCPENRDTLSRKSGHPPVPKIGTDQQTLKTEQGVWDLVLQQLQLSIPANTFAVFLDGTKLISIAEGVATVGTPRPHVCEWLQMQMAPRIKKVLAAELAARNEATPVSEVRCVVLSG